MWINHDQSTQQRRAICKHDWEGIQYNNMIDTTSFTFGQYFYVQKQKEFINNTIEHTVKTNTPQSHSLHINYHPLLGLITVYLR